MAKKYDWRTHNNENAARYWSDQFSNEANVRRWATRNATWAVRPSPRPDGKGWIYILSNPAMPGLVKVGYSMNDPTERAAELYTSGVPLPNIVEYEMRVDDPSRLEAHAHERLDHCRVNSRREWFRCSVRDAITAIGV
jgi:hypothetical protein